MNKDVVNRVKEIRRLIKGNETKEVKRRVNEIESYVLADIIEILEPEKQVVVFRLLEKDRALTVFEYFETEIQQEVIQNFTDERAIEYFKGLEPDDRARIMDELPAKVTGKLMNALSKEEREMTNLIMGYELGTAGHIKTPKYVRLKKNLTVKEALQKLREKGQKGETLYNIYITDNKRVIEGVVSLQDLILADDEATLEAIMTRIRYDEKDEDVAKLLQDSDKVALPVVDREDRIIGIVTVDDAMDVLEDEALAHPLCRGFFVFPPTRCKGKATPREVKTFLRNGLSVPT